MANIANSTEADDYMIMNKSKKEKKLSLQYLYILLLLKNGIRCLSEIQLKLDIPYCVWQTYWGRQG